jgi:DHA1 family tetracycline resistance protein-like MFS transporter
MTDQTTPAAPKSRAAFVFIFVTVLFDMMALGLAMPILPKLVASFLNNDAAAGAEMFGLFGTAWALMQFIFSPLLGMVSDRFGRRPVVLFSNLGLALDYILMAWAPTLAWLFVGRIISGITSASYSTAMAYLADITAPEQRAAVFGKVGAAFGAGFILGPAIGGLLGALNPRLPFWVAALLGLANFLYGLLILPESLPLNRRASFRWSRANPVGAVRLLGSSAGLVVLAVVHFINQIAHVVLPSMFVIYASYRYGWDPATVGFTLALVGVCAMVVQLGVIGPVVRRFGERTAVFAGLVFGMIGFLIIGLAPWGYLSWVGIPFLSLWGLANPSIQALMTRLVSPAEQGQLQGANSSVQSVAQLIGPSIFTLSFAYFIRPGGFMLPGAPFILAAAMMVVAVLVGARVVANVATAKAATKAAAAVTPAGGS